MNLTPWWALVLGAQAIVMAVDEGYCHRRRGLGRFEGWGHPLDTLSVLGCLGIALLLPWSSAASTAFVAASVGSCLLITKDEGIHARECSGLEHWIHALLFILHPVVLALTHELWKAGANKNLLQGQALFTGLLLAYQVLYWQVLRAPQPRRL